MTPAKLGAPARDPALGLGGRPFPYRAPAAPVGALALLGGSRCLRRGDRARGRPARPGGARRVRARAPPLRGEFLKGEFFTWLEPYRMDYRRRLLDAARSAGAMAEGMGDAARAVAFHRAILEREPTDEDAARGLMRCLARCGDVAGARTAFEELSQALVDELDDPACGRRRRLERCWRNWSGPPRVASASGLQTAGPGRRPAGAATRAAGWCAAGGGAPALGAAAVGGGGGAGGGRGRVRRRVRRPVGAARLARPRDADDPERDRLPSRRSSAPTASAVPRRRVGAPLDGRWAQYAYTQPKTSSASLRRP